jgi:ectoine hydroxylase-related dioxygenase (phytanoyl-CoA dioxygenase family)
MPHGRFVETGSGFIAVEEMKPSKSISDLEHFGFLFLESFLPRETVQSAQEAIPPTTASLMEDQHAIVKNHELMSILEHPALFELFERIYERNCKTIPFKWLRRVGTGLYTGLHCDYVYVGKIHKEILTVWMPLTDIELERGALIISPESHRNKQWQPIQQNYLEKPLENGTNSGWLNPHQLGFSPRWVSRDFKMGDVVILHSKVMHMTAMNMLQVDRYSVDTRWIPLS